MRHGEVQHGAEAQTWWEEALCEAAAETPRGESRQGAEVQMQREEARHEA